MVASFAALIRLPSEKQQISNLLKAFGFERTLLKIKKTSFLFLKDVLSAFLDGGSRGARTPDLLGVNETL